MVRVGVHHFYGEDGYTVQTAECSVDLVFVDEDVLEGGVLRRANANNGMSVNE